VLVGFWIFMMRKFNVSRQASFMERNAALMGPAGATARTDCGGFGAPQ
jgi:hypothetical protein